MLPYLRMLLYGLLYVLLGIDAIIQTIDVERLIDASDDGIPYFMFQSFHLTLLLYVFMEKHFGSYIFLIGQAWNI